jgi:hypothetical protein
MFDNSIFDNLMFDNLMFDNSMFDNSMFDNSMFDNSMFDNSMFDNSMFDNSMFDNLTFANCVEIVPTITMEFIFFKSQNRPLSHDLQYRVVHLYILCSFKTLNLLMVSSTET